MYYIKRFKQLFCNYLYDHPIQKDALSLIKVLLITILSAFAFAFGFNTFINPNFTAISNIEGIQIHQLASCGASGFSQSILHILKLCKIEWLVNESNSNLIYWIIYFLVNIPLLILSWCKIGKRFCVFTCINIASASILGILLKSNDPNFFINQVSSIFIDQPLARVLFAGICTGISTGLAFSIETCPGGTDVISYYISEKKSLLAGKYSLIINLFVVSLFTILSIFPLDAMYNERAISIPIAFSLFIYTCIYIYVNTATMDKINTANLKVQVQIITTERNLPNSLIAALPHSCTILNGYGGYSLEGKYVILIAVRKKEISKIRQVCKKEDPKSFVDVIPLDNVYGKFYRKKIKWILWMKCIIILIFLRNF